MGGKYGSRATKIPKQFGFYLELAQENGRILKIIVSRNMRQ